MNFFAEQDRARKHTRVLLVLFLLAVAALLGLTNLLVAFAFWVMSDHTASSFADCFSWQQFRHILFLVSSTILLVIGARWFSLRDGGKAVMQGLGGIRLSPNSDNLAQQRVLNVVEEMAIASSMPVPPVYLLARDQGINALAAGHRPADAVIGITQGALDQLNREQLQGVIAHEFSHILNGDMRLNMRLMAVLAGIEFISDAGRFLMDAEIDSQHREHRFNVSWQGDLRLNLLGFCLFVLGWLGYLFASAIKFAINRQREYLADASAVQFTRNATGIADALRIIGGYTGGSIIRSAKASESSHMFIADSLGSMMSFDSHPPLEKRIRKLLPGWQGEWIKRYAKPIARPEPPIAAMKSAADIARLTGVAVPVSAVVLETQQALLREALSDGEDADRQVDLALIPKYLRDQAHEPFGAVALAYALFLSANADVQQKQLEYIKRDADAGQSLLCLQIQAELENLPRAYWLPLLETAMPALKNQSPKQYSNFKRTLLLLIRSEQQIEMLAWCLYQLIQSYLSAEFETPRQPRPVYRQIRQLDEACCQLMSTLAHHGHSGIEAAREAYAQGMASLKLQNKAMLPREACQLDAFVSACRQLSRAYPLLKPKILKGLAECARQDGKIAAEEKEMIASIAAVIDCPAPDLFAQL